MAMDLHRIAAVLPLKSVRNTLLPELRARPNKTMCAYIQEREKKHAMVIGSS
ncbi:hypothetical protein SAMN05421772_111136 [Paracoccus saliphilus]|uniref:Uncharacterized protein n=1 Tax=Paracoccus saliphilus TaxID=405559 RepID=A0AA45W664_9RHOB|nr:hypothetical protein SAMN05421772_111136 [Paracoccus saliphilus]